jgi:hypothetical protein
MKIKKYKNIIPHMYFVYYNNIIIGMYSTLQKSQDVIIKHWHQNLRFNRLEDLEYASPHEIILKNWNYIIITHENQTIVFDINNFLKNNNIRICTLKPNVSELYDAFVTI